LTPIKSAAPLPVAEPPAEKSEPVVAKEEPASKAAGPTIAKAEPVAPIAAAQPKVESTTEPPAPVSPPPSEPPVAVATVPGLPKVAQIVPPPVATSSLEPAPRPPTQSQPQAATPPESATPETPAASDWHAFVTEGDALMQRRQRDEAMDAYLNAFDLASDGRAISASEVAQLCKKVADLQRSFGSVAEARQTLERGRQSLKRMTGGKDGGERQKYMEQIENTLRTLPRD
jgi:hypothetical protein